MLKTRQRLGKYRIIRRIAEGGFAYVYEAYDTIEGIPVALKIPRRRHVTPETLESFRKEARVTAGLDHPNILPLKNAAFIGGSFVIVYPLGESTLAERLERRLALRTALGYTEQMLEAVAHAHARGILHCDIKPENMILFAGHRLRLSDFGIAKIALSTRTVHGSGTGTIGYVAPEQAFGKPSLRSDVFSLGLVLYRMFAGVLPEWPFEYPPIGYDRIRQSLHPDFVRLVIRAIDIDQRQRHRDAVQMLEGFRRVKPRTLAHRNRRQRRRRQETPDKWQTLRVREFRRRTGRLFGSSTDCRRCHHPMAEMMLFCPWCGVEHRKYTGPVSFPGRCRRCGRGTKSDWQFCAWCYGGAIQEPTGRRYADKRYTVTCPSCRQDLMPFMRYCPWCRSKVRRAWRVDESKHRCSRCGWGILGDHWSNCPWCGKGVGS